MSPVASTPANLELRMCPDAADPACWSPHMSTTVWAVRATPLWKVMPSRSPIVHTVRSSLGVMPVATLPTYPPAASCSSNLSNTAIIML